MDERPTALLSRQLRLPVLTGTGERLGDVADLVVPMGPARPCVSHLLVRSTRSTGYRVPWADVAALEEDRVVLRAGAELQQVTPSQPELTDDEVLLARDVMDTQVVDL